VSSQPLAWWRVVSRMEGRRLSLAAGYNGFLAVPRIIASFYEIPGTVTRALECWMCVGGGAAPRLCSRL
jgi:hypothetical protein